MSLDKVRRVLSAMQKIVSRGEQFAWSGLTHIAQESGLNRQTVWRYLQQLEREKMVYKIERTWRGERAYRYYMTAEGKNLLGSFRVLKELENTNNENE